MGSSVSINSGVISHMPAADHSQLHSGYSGATYVNKQRIILAGKTQGFVSWSTQIKG